MPYQPTLTAFSVGGGFGALFPVYQVTKVTDIPNMLFWQVNE